MIFGGVPVVDLFIFLKSCVFLAGFVSQKTSFQFSKKLCFLAGFVPKNTF